MPTSNDRTPQDPFRKSYTTIVRSNGALLPIEERLGKRILRSLDPESREARRLLRDGLVELVMPDGTKLSGQSIEVIYERLTVEANARLTSTNGSPAWRRACRDTLADIKRWQRALAIDH